MTFFNSQKPQNILRGDCTEIEAEENPTCVPTAFISARNLIKLQTIICIPFQQISTFVLESE